MRRKRRHMAKRAECAAEIAGQRPYIGAFAAIGFELGMIGVRHVQRSRLAITTGRGASSMSLLLARQVIGALAVDLDAPSSAAAPA